MDKIAPVLQFIPIAGLIFQAGRQSQRIDELFSKTHALELDQRSMRDLLYDIHGKVSELVSAMNSKKS